MRKIKQKICTVIWEMSEYYNIPLGWFAPYIFGGMIGCKGKRVNEDGSDYK